MIRTADSVLLTCCPPAPLARYTSIRRSAGLISISISSSTSGETKTAANDVCLRFPESNGDLRTRRCTPVSVRNLPKTYSPEILMVALLIPATSPAETSINSVLKPCPSPQRRYIRSSISAQSCASVPPDPAWISTKALQASISPENIRRNSRPTTSVSRSFKSSIILFILSSSSSSTDISSSSSASFKPLSSSSMVTTIFSSRERSCPSFCAFSGLSHMPGCSSSRLTSSNSSLRRSKSKIPPK